MVLSFMAEPMTLRARWLSTQWLCLRHEVVGSGSDPRTCKSRAKFPGMILGGSPKKISLTMESSDTIGRPYPHLCQ